MHPNKIATSRPCKASKSIAKNLESPPAFSNNPRRESKLKARRTTERNKFSKKRGVVSTAEKATRMFEVCSGMFGYVRDMFGIWSGMSLKPAQVLLEAARKSYLFDMCTVLMDSCWLPFCGDHANSRPFQKR